MTRLHIERVAHGGDGIGRIEGKTVFVHGAVPGDHVSVEITDSHKRYDRARIVEILEPSSDRTQPLCRHTDVCGGCTWQHVDYQAQLAWKTDVVESQLAHVGRLEVGVAPTEQVGNVFNYRNRMDFSVEDGRLALHRRASHDLVSLQECRLLVEPLAHVVSAAHDLKDLSGSKRRVTLRAGVNTGDLIAIADEPIDGLSVDQAQPRDAIIHEEVAGARFRISGRAFFQGNTAGAARLVELVGEAVGDSPGVLADVYAGVGLFSATVGARAARVVALELDRRAASDIATNAPAAEILVGPVERTIDDLRPPIDSVIIDPPRDGVDARTIHSIAVLKPAVIASVSCDAATFARDVRRLIDAGYRLDWVRPLDLLPHTPHVEIVGRLVLD